MTITNLPSLSAIELPVVAGHTVEFGEHGTRYVVSAYHETAWRLHGTNGSGKLYVIADFLSHGDEYLIDKGNSYQPVGTDWRAAVRRMLR